jgi:3',5'-cyclic AMP phosphodiesterase CpdA
MLLATAMIRLAHLSDIHITTPRLPWTLRDWFNKRHAAWMNFRWLGRGARFGRADEVLAKLMDEIAERRPDLTIFSGDATALGFESEIRRAAELLRVGDASMPPGLAVPGNHDYCTAPAACSGHFERHFEPWLTGERIDGSAYPFVRRVGNVQIIAVNSCTGNFWPWDASGCVGHFQRQRLAKLLASLEPGPRILVTHYPVCYANGEKEMSVHGLRDLEEMVEVADAGGVSLWIHGHRHKAYYFQEPALAPFPVVCIGSATQTRFWSYGEYTIDGSRFHAQLRVFNGAEGRFVDGEAFNIEMKVNAAV